MLGLFPGAFSTLSGIGIPGAGGQTASIGRGEPRARVPCQAAGTIERSERFTIARLYAAG